MARQRGSCPRSKECWKLSLPVPHRRIRRTWQVIGKVEAMKPWVLIFLVVVIIKLYIIVHDCFYVFLFELCLVYLYIMPCNQNTRTTEQDHSKVSKQRSTKGQGEDRKQTTPGNNHMVTQCEKQCYHVLQSAWVIWTNIHTRPKLMNINYINTLTTVCHREAWLSISNHRKLCTATLWFGKEQRPICHTICREIHRNTYLVFKGGGLLFSTPPTNRKRIPSGKPT